MKGRYLSLLALTLAGLFYLLVNESYRGINLSIFATVIAAVVWWLKRGEVKSWFFRMLILSVLLLSVTHAWHGESWTSAMLIINLFMLAGSAALPDAASPSLVFSQSAVSVFGAQLAFFRNFRQGPARSQGSWRKWLIYLVPAAIFIIFIGMYRAANPLFDYLVKYVEVHFSELLEIFSIGGLVTFFAGLLISNLFVSATSVRELAESWKNTPRLLLRRRRQRQGRVAGLNRLLLNEHRAGVLLLGGLNIMLLLLNITDLQVVWFGFRWDGQLLRSFVHEGTWMLIFSVLLAGATTLYFFRGNLNFYSGARTLRILVATWLVQNAFLLLSVGVRNMRYIQYYGLAYKRIGVIFFLIAVAGSLLFIWLKVRNGHSMPRFISRSLSLSLGVMTMSALPDWSSIITRYNLEHYRQSFVHIEFLMDMPDHVLPVLKAYKGELSSIRQEQGRLGYDYSDTINDIPFTVRLDQRIAAFKQEEALRDWRGWIWARKRALHALGKD